jgi:hypothetical protein
MIARDYVNSICEVDISTIDEVRPDLLMIITGGPDVFQSAANITPTTKSDFS